MQQRNHGLTLIEMLITLVVIGILGGVAAYGIAGGALAYSTSEEAVTTLGKLRLASARMAREIRSVRRNPISTSNYDIATMTASTFAFNRLEADDVTVTGVTITGAPPLVTLAYSTPAGSQILTDQVASLTFSYIQADASTPATGSADVAFVEIELELASNGNTYAERTQVALRNQP